MAIAAVTVISLLFFRPGRDQRVESPTVITGQVGTLQDLVPTEDELEVARNRLEDSFIAYVACNQTSQFFAAQARRMSDVAASYGLGFRLYDSNSQASQEIVQIERARTDGAQALMVCVVDAGVVRDVLTSVDEANIPLTLYNIDEPPTYGGILIRVEDYEMGLIVGRYIGQVVAAERDGQANVVILDYPSLPSIVARADGLQDGLLEYAPQAQIVGRYRGGTSRYAEDSVRQLLSDGVTIDVILSINDDGSYGAIRALESARTDPSAVIIGSIDAEDVAREYVREGYFMRATLEVASEVPSGAINSLVKQLAGGTLPEIVQAPAGDLITADSFGD